MYAGRHKPLAIPIYRAKSESISLDLQYISHRTTRCQDCTQNSNINTVLQPRKDAGNLHFNAYQGQ
jgi:hypothetical protein